MRVERDPRYDRLRSRFEKAPKYWGEYLKLAFSEDVGRLMDERDMNRADLARAIATSRAYVTRLFSGTFNPTLETLVKVALALDARVALHLHPCQTEVCWLEAPRSVVTADATLWATRERQPIRQPVSRRRSNVLCPTAA